MPYIEFAGQSSQDGKNVPASTSRLINCYLEPVEEAGKTAHVLKSVLGTVQFCDLSDALGRAVAEVNGTLYAIAGGNLYSVDDTGTATNLGAVVDGEFPTIAGYEGNVTIETGTAYYVYDGTTLSEVTGGAISAVGSVTFLGGYTILTEAGGAKFEWTELQDPSARNALYVATAESRDDDLLRGLAVGSFLYMFGTQSIEIWYQTGAAGAGAFARLSGGVIERGLKAKGLVARIGEGAMFVGDDNVAYLLQGNSITPLFNAGLQTALEDGSPTHCFMYEDRGHRHVVIRFSDRPAWVFDVATGRWHERASGNTLTAWGVLGAAKAYGSWQAVNGSSVVATLSRTNADLGATMIRRAIGTTIEVEGRPFAPTFEVRCRRGHQSSAVDLLASFSDDGGETWSDADPRSIGGQGNFDERAIWYEGLYESFTPRIDITDAAEIPIYSRAIVELS